MTFRIRIECRQSSRRTNNRNSFEGAASLLRELPTKVGRLRSEKQTLQLPQKYFENEFFRKDIHRLENLERHRISLGDE